jgi:hypothetical protein
MTTKSQYLCAMSAIFICACGTLWGCGARSVMENPEDDLPTLPGTGGALTGGTAGTSAATGGTFWSTGGTVGTPATGDTGGTPATGGTGGTPAAGGAGVTPATGGTGGTLATGGTGGTVATGGTGGTRATGGTAGTPATGGAGGGFIGSCAYPSCLWNLIRGCQAVGQCTQQELQIAGGTTDLSELCCSNGVNEIVTIRTQGSILTGTVDVTSNGNKCYDVNLTTSADGSMLYYVWLDPSGQSVAKASIAMTDSSTPIIYCGSGESMAMTSDCAPDGSQAAVITTGTCR